MGYHKNLIGSDLHAPSSEQVENNTAAIILKMRVVTFEVIGTTFPEISLAETGDHIRGVTQGDILIGGTGNITALGFSDNFDTSAWTAGTELYLTTGTDGQLTSTPNGPALAVVMVSSATDGVLYVEHSVHDQGVTDHGDLTGLADDDHQQYAHLTGRAGNTTLAGGTLNNGFLDLKSTTALTKGYIQVDSTFRPISDSLITLGANTFRWLEVWARTIVGGNASAGNIAINTTTHATKGVLNVDGGVTVTGVFTGDGSGLTNLPSSGVTDHGALTGLADDDHTQYSMVAGRTGESEHVGGDLTVDGEMRFSLQSIRLGQDTLAANNFGQRNVAIGFNALKVSTVNDNVAVGHNTGLSLLSGTQNVILGSSSGTTLSIGNNNILIGYSVQTSAANANNEVVIGKASTEITRLFGKLGLNTASNPTAFLQMKGEFDGTITGSVTILTSSPTCTGINTLFETDLIVGQLVRIDNQNFYVVSIFSNTSLQLSGTATSNNSGLTVNTQSSMMDIERADGVPAFFIDKGGFVGIGVNPDQLLHISSNIDGDARLKIVNPNTGANATAGYEFSLGISTWIKQVEGDGSLRTYSGSLSNYIMIQDNTGSTSFGIGLDKADASAVVEISSGNKGFLPPRLTTALMNLISTPATGLEIYNTSIGSKFIYDGTNWRALGTGESTNVSYGGLTNIAGSFNTAIGPQAGQDQVGSNNVMIGYRSAETLDANGDDNVAIGVRSMLIATTAADNVVIGSEAGQTLTTGSNNILIGKEAEASSATASNETVIGNALTVSTELNGTITSVGNMTSQLTGTVTVVDNNTNVLGSGTAFLGEVREGSALKLNGQVFTVFSVTNDTSLVLDSANFGAASGIDVFTDPDYMKIHSGDGRNQFAVKANGFVGIGTHAPIRPIHVESTSDPMVLTRYTSATVNEGTTVQLRKSQTDTFGANAALGGNSLIGDLDFQAATGSGYGSSAGVKAFTDGSVFSTATPGRLEFQTTPIATVVPVTRMTIKQDGKVGIGTDSPAQFLHIKDDDTVVRTVIENTGVGTSNQASFSIETATSDWLVWTQNDSTDQFRFWSTALFKNVMTLAAPNGGRVGILNDAPTTELDVNGTITASGVICNGDVETDRIRYEESFSVISSGSAIFTTSYLEITEETLNTADNLFWIAGGLATTGTVLVVRVNGTAAITFKHEGASTSNAMKLAGSVDAVLANEYDTISFIRRSNGLWTETSRSIL